MLPTHDPSERKTLWQAIKIKSSRSLFFIGNIQSLSSLNGFNAVPKNFISIKRNLEQLQSICVIRCDQLIWSFLAIAAVVGHCNESYSTQVRWWYHTSNYMTKTRWSWSLIFDRWTGIHWISEDQKIAQLPMIALFTVWCSDCRHKINARVKV